jgi:hypothetical protein
MIGACFPRDKFIALKSLVVFGLDVSSDFRLALAFPAKKIITLKSLVVLVDGSAEKSFKIVFPSALSCIHELSKTPVTTQKLSKIGCFPGITRQLSKQS